MEKKLTFQRLNRLTGSARRRFNPVMDWNPQPEIEKGVSQLWSVNQGELLILTRIENAELVIVAAAGKNLIAACIYILATAINQGFKTIRFHTVKPAVVRLIKKHFPDFETVETRSDGERVLRMGVPNG